MIKMKFLNILIIFIFTSLSFEAEWMQSVYKNNSSSVVTVINIQNGRQAGVGSGFIIDQTGLVVTNHHVIDGAHQIQVVTKSEVTYDVLKILTSNKKID